MRGSLGTVALTASERRLRAQQAAHTGWANTFDRTARTQAGRDGMRARIQRELIERKGQTWWDSMTPEGQEQATDSASKAYFSGLALRASKARRAKRQAADDTARANVGAVGV